MKTGIERAIELAVKGGWNPAYKFIKEQMFLDPSFWQCLGKSLGWEEETEYEILCEPIDRSYNVYELAHEKTWKYEWRRFIDHLAQGKDPETFFDNLIPKQ